MLHPILSKSTTVWGYLLTWLLLSVLQAAMFVNLLDFSIPTSVIDSIIYNTIFLTLGLSFWFPLAFADKTKNQFLLIFNNMGVYFIYTFIWVALSFHLSTWVLGGDVRYVEFTHRFLPFRAIWGSVLFLFLGMLYHLFDFYQSLEEKKLQEEHLKQLVKDAELKALKSQLNPHFLFNSLNSISSLTITDNDKAREMINKLSDFMRYSLKNHNTSLLPLREELKNMAKYLEIEKVRFGDRLLCESHIDEECKDQHLPAMILQPLYENAVKHGVYESIEPVLIRTFVRMVDQMLEITIINNYDPDSTPPKGEGVGLSNIRNRLKMIYHRDDLLTITRENHHFEAIVLIPQTQPNV